MYNGLLHAHNGLRWLVLLSLILAIVLAFYGWFAKKEWKGRDKSLSLILMIFMDLQFLVGMFLYIFFSPITKLAFRDFGAAMKNPDLRFYVVEHALMMLIAVALVHIGRSVTKKDITGEKRHRAAAIFYTLSLVIILLAIPWDRALF